MFAVGIDVSKEKSDVTLLGGKSPWHGQFPNTAKGWKALVKAVRKRARKQVRCAMEPTATYHLPIAKALHDAGVEVMLVNPRWSSAMAKALGQRGKTDVADSAMLAHYALHSTQQGAFKVWTPPDNGLLELRELVRRRAQLVKTRTQEKNRAKEIRATEIGRSVLKDIEELIVFLDQRISKLERAIKAHIQSHKALKEDADLLLSLPGIGDILAAVTVAELGFTPSDLGPKQLVAMAGLDPMPKQSGAMDARRSISKRGNKHLRTAMFLAAWSAPRSCPHVAAKRQDMLDRGKPKKVITVAIARRLLVAAATILRTREPWDGARFHALASLDNRQSI